MSSHQTPPESGGAPDAGVRTAFRAGFGGVAATSPAALVVENDYGSKVALIALLQRIRLSVVAVENGHTALDALAERDDIAIVLMDILMPIMDGYETMTAIRRRPRFEALPIIAVTGKDATGERERCIAAGASDYVPKPIDTSVLLTAIARWMGEGELATSVQW